MHLDWSINELGADSSGKIAWNHGRGRCFGLLPISLVLQLMYLSNNKKYGTQQSLRDWGKLLHATKLPLFRFIPYFVSCYPTTYTEESLGGSESGWRRRWWRQRQRRDPWRKRRGVGPHQTMDRQTGRLATWLAGITIVFLKLHLRNVNIHVYLSLQLWSVPGRGNMARGLVVPNCWRQLDLHSLGNWATVKAKSTHLKTLLGKSCKM